ncbi:MAG: CsbD family protein [Verrucomicrobiales bacterium]
MTDTQQEHDQSTLDQAKGKLKEGLGNLTGDKSTEVEGKFDQLKGKIKEGIADVKDRIDGEKPKQ